PKSRDGLKTSARSFIPVYFCIMKCIQFNIPLPDTISIPLSFSDLEIFDPRTYKNITQPLEKEESSLSLIMENIEKTLIYHRPGMLELQAMFSPLGEYNDFSKNLRSCFSFNEFKFLFVGKVNFIATDLIKAFRNISDQNSNEDQFIWFKEWLATLKNGELRKIWFEITATFTFNSSIELGYLTIQQLPIENLPTTRSCFKKLEVPAYTDKDLMLAGPVSAILNVMNFQKSSFTIKYNGILKKSKNKISVWVSINGRTTGVSTIPLINSEVTIGEKKNKTCINCNCLEQNATPLCEEGNSFHIFSYPTLNSLENYLITENKGNVNELDIKLAFVDSEGNWDKEEKNFGNDTLKENVVAEKTTAKLPKKPNFSKVKENNAILIDRLKNHKLVLEAKAAKENKRQLEEQKLKDQNLKLERRAKFLLLNEFLKSLEDFKLNTLISEKKKEQLLKCNSNNEVKCVDNINSLIECDDADLNFSKNYGV
ncbi:hypothetical protein HK099_006081, partial [Clydaea vesicula]